MLVGKGRGPLPSAGRHPGPRHGSRLFSCSLSALSPCSLLVASSYQSWEAPRTSVNLSRVPQVVGGLEPRLAAPEGRSYHLIPPSPRSLGAHQ